jgi:putative redox protein
MTQNAVRITFPGSLGDGLAARLDLPTGTVRAYALFAHCFTCSKDGIAARQIAAKLAALGIAVLRFDFTGLGSSEGDFANTNFSLNVEDLVRAADHLRTHFAAPALLIGHSLGGAAVLAAAHRIPEPTAVATIAAPSDVGHVLQHFHADLAQIARDGIANVTFAGRTFAIRRQFIEDTREQALKDRIASLRKALLVLHAPIRPSASSMPPQSSRGPGIPRASSRSTRPTTCCPNSTMPSTPPRSWPRGRHASCRSGGRIPSLRTTALS